MKNPSNEVITKEQGDLVDEISAYFDGVGRAFEHQAQYAFMAGLKLHALKATCEHGNKNGALGFMELRERLLPKISRSAANRFMDFTTLLQEKLPTVGNFNSGALQLTNGDLPEKQKEQVLKAVHDATEGKTWTQLYRDLGRIRKAQTPGTYERKPRDLKKLIDEAGEVDETPFIDWCGDTLMLLEPKTTTLGEQTTAMLQRMENIRLQLGHAIQKILKSRGAKTKCLKP